MTGSADARLLWALARWRALLVGVLTVPLATMAVVSSLRWPGQVFPGFFILANGLVPTVGLYTWTGPRAGVPFHGRVVAADDHTFRSPGEIYAYAAARPEGAPVRYRIEKDGHALSVTAPTMRFGARDYWFTFGPFILSGLLVIGTGVAVGLLQPRTEEAKAFLTFGACSGLIMLTAPPIYDPDMWWITPANLLAQAMWGASFLHLGLVFPIMRRSVARRRAWLLAPYAPAAALTLWSWRGFFAEPPDLRPVYLAFGYTAASMIALPGLFALAYRENATPITRARLRVILPGFVLASALACFGFLENSRGGGTFPINLSVPFSSIFLVAVGYAIARHDLFEIDRLVKQAVAYATLTLGVMGGYALALVVLGWLPSLRFLRSSPAFNIAFVVLVAIVFEPLRLKVQDLVDRTFFRARVDYRQTVREVSGALTTLLDLDQILARVGTTLDAGFVPSSLAIVLWLPAGARIWRLDRSGRLVTTPGSDTAELRAHLERASDRSWLVPRPDDAPDALGPASGEAAALDAALVVPLRHQSRVVGAFALGPRRSGLPYSGGDRELLETLAAQSVVAIQNALLFGEVTELNVELEAKVSARTAELERSNGELARAYRDLQDAQAQLLQTEKMASLGQLVAGMAHEINTPVTAVVGNVKPLWNELQRLRDRAALHGDAVLEEIERRMKAIFEVMARGAERTAGIVQDLRVYSRVGETRPLPMDLHEGIDASLRLLRPRWVDRIEIHREYGPLPRVEAAAGQVNQVFMNILANACDAIETRGNIWIRTAHDGATVSVTIRDDGCGIAAERRGRVFDPFFTTKPVGKGTGLGLAISASIVHDHGGTIDVESEPGSGSTFTVRLPLCAAVRAGPDTVATRAST
jgi:signal transduction histidine kinase